MTEQEFRDLVTAQCMHHGDGYIEASNKAKAIIVELKVRSMNPKSITIELD